VGAPLGYQDHARNQFARSDSVAVAAAKPDKSGALPRAGPCPVRDPQRYSDEVNRLGELERAIMDVLWDTASPLTVREVSERLAERELAHTTVMTVLDRLAKKGVVIQEKQDRAYRYAPAQSREEMTAAVMLDALGDVPDATRDAALAHFVGRLSPEALAAAIEAARKGG
jgi:predicted transcriptional regulator